MRDDAILPLQIQVLPEYVIINAQMNDCAFHLEFSLRANFAFPSLAQYMRGTPDEQVFAVQVLRQWSQVIAQIELKYVDPTYQLVATKKLLRSFSSEEFKNFWQEAEMSDAEYDSIKHNLFYLVALYSDNTNDVETFVSEVKDIFIQKDSTIPIGLDLEKQVISVLYRDTAQKEIKQELLYNDSLYNEIIKWLQKRVNIREILNLVSQKRKHNQWRKKECRMFLNRYRQARRRSSKQEMQNSLSNALRLCPDNVKVAYLVRRNNSLGKVPTKRAPLSLSPLLRRYPIIVLFGFSLLLLYYALPRLIKLLIGALYNVGNMGNIEYTGVFSQLLFLVLYSFFAILMFKSLTETLVLEPLRTWLALAFIGSVLPVTGGLWSQLIGLSDNQWSGIILATIGISCFFFYRDGYREIYHITQDVVETCKRTAIMLGILIGQALLYALIASDFVGRFNFPGISPSPDMHKLTQDYLWRVFPKLIELPVGSNFHLYIFTPFVILLTFSPFAFTTLQSGIATLPFAYSKQRND